MQLVLDGGRKQYVGQLGDGRPAVAALGDGNLARPFDQLEDLGAGVLPDDVAEEPSEQPDVVAHRGVLLRGWHRYRVGEGAWLADRAA